jgi:predicted NBD/HSP70 family sugar kinase
MNLRGKVRSRLEQKIEGRNGDGLLGAVFDLVDRLIPLAEGRLLGIGVGTPGLVDSRKGVVRDAFNLGWNELGLGTLLKERYGVPVHIANDSQAAALAEFTFGGAAASPHLLVVKMSRGIGLGIVLDRRIYSGDGFGAGEIGHVVFAEEGEPCRCGHRGCLETLTGSESIIRTAQAIARQGDGSFLSRLAATPDSIDIEAVTAAVAAGDVAMGAHIAEVGRQMGRALAGMVGTLNVRRIVLAGSVAGFGRALVEPIRREIERRALPALAGETTVETTTLGNDIVLLGAAALILNGELGLP